MFNRVCFSLFQCFLDIFFVQTCLLVFPCLFFSIICSLYDNQVAYSCIQVAFNGAGVESERFRAKYSNVLTPFLLVPNDYLDPPCYDQILAIFHRFCSRNRCFECLLCLSLIHICSVKQTSQFAKISKIRRLNESGGKDAFVKL